MIKWLKTKYYGVAFIICFALTLIILINIPTKVEQTHEIHILRANIDMSGPATQDFLNQQITKYGERKALTMLLENQEAARLKQQRLEDMYLWPVRERILWATNEY